MANEIPEYTKEERDAILSRYHEGEKVLNTIKEFWSKGIQPDHGPNLLFETENGILYQLETIERKDEIQVGGMVFFMTRKPLDDPGGKFASLHFTIEKITVVFA